MLEHVRDCGFEKGCDSHDIRLELRIMNEYFNENEDITFTDFPTIAVFHSCTWIECDWEQFGWIEMIECPPDGQQTLDLFIDKEERFG